MSKPLRIEDRFDEVKGEKKLLINGHGIVGEYFGECFVKGYGDKAWTEYGGEPALPMSEDVLMFNKYKGYDSMCLYWMNVEIHVTVDEFMAFGDWSHARNGDWVIWCPLSMLRVYPRIEYG